MIQISEKLLQHHESQNDVDKGIKILLKRHIENSHGAGRLHVLQMCAL